MKKLLLVAILALSAFSAKAQFYAGGQFGLSAGNNRTTFDVYPEVGYVLNEKMSVGAVVGFGYNALKDSYKDSNFLIAPYFRYNLLEIGPVTVFADAQLQINFWTNKDLILDTKDNGSTAGIGVAPGIAIPVADNLSFVAHLGRVGYFNDTFVMGADATNVLAGLYYSF